MFNVGACRKIKACKYCGKIFKFDLWTHDKECEKSKGEKVRLLHESLTFNVEKDWKDFIERRFEPHTFRARWNNIMCPYCFYPCKNIFHTFSCPFVPPERRQVNCKIAFWKA